MGSALDWTPLPSWQGRLGFMDWRRRDKDALWANRSRKSSRCLSSPGHPRQHPRGRLVVLYRLRRIATMDLVCVGVHRRGDGVRGRGQVAFFAVALSPLRVRARHLLLRSYRRRYRLQTRSPALSWHCQYHRQPRLRSVPLAAVGKSTLLLLPPLLPALTAHLPLPLASRTMAV